MSEDDPVPLSSEDDAGALSSEAVDGAASKVEVADAAELAIPPAASERPSGPEPKKSTGVATLVDLFTVRGANPTNLLRALEKSPQWRFADDDVEAALGLLPECDPHLVRTRRLVHEAVHTRAGRFIHAVRSFAARAAVDDLPEGWLSDEVADPSVYLAETVELLAPRLAEKQHQKRAHCVLMMTIDLLSPRTPVTIEAVVGAIYEPVGRRPVGELADAAARQRRVALITEPGNDLDDTGRLLDLLSPWRSAARSADIRADAAERARDRAVQAEAQAAGAASGLEAERVDLLRQLAQAHEEVRLLSERSRDVRITATSDVAQLRARSLAFMNTRLRDLMVTAREASEVEPPRAETAARLLSQALTELQKEVEWLRSSG